MESASGPAFVERLRTYSSRDASKALRNVNDMRFQRRQLTINAVHSIFGADEIGS
jgi:hypothetical protein